MMYTDISKEKLEDIFVKGEEFLTEEKYKEALVCFNTILEYYPQHLLSLFYKGLIYFYTGKKEFSKYFEKILLNDDDSSFTWKVKGVIFELQGNYEQALKCYEISLEKSFLDLQTLENKMEVLLRLRRYKEALSICNILIEFSEEKEEKIRFINIKIEILNSVDSYNYEELLKTYEILLQETPDDQKAREKRISYLFSLRKYREALFYIEKELKINPSDKNLWDYKYFIYRDFYGEKGIKMFLKDAVNFSYVPQPFYIVAYHYFIKSEYKKAFRYIDKSLKIDPLYEESIFLKAELLEKINKTSSALKAIDACIKRNQSNIKYWDFKLSLLWKTEKWNEIKKIYKDALNHIEPTYSIYHYIVDSLIKTASYEEAFSLLKKGYEKHRKDINFLADFALVAFKLNRYKTAFLLYSDIIKEVKRTSFQRKPFEVILPPEYFQEVLLNFVDCCLKLNSEEKTEEALQTLESFKYNFREKEEFTMKKAEVMYFMGEYEESISLYIESIKMIDALYNNKKDLKIKKSKKLRCIEGITHCFLAQEENKEIYELLLQIIKKEKIEEIWFYIGEVFFETGKTTQAESCYKKAIKSNPSFPEPYYMMGVIKLKQEKYRRAIKYFEKHLKLNRTNPLAWYYKGVCYRKIKYYTEALDSLLMAEKLSLENNDELRGSSLIETGKVYEEKNSLEQALKYYRKTYNLSYKDIQWKIDEIRVLSKLKRFKEAFSITENLLLKDPYEDNLLFIKGLLYEKLNKNELALSIYEELFNFSDLTINALIRKIHIYETMGKYHDALELCNILFKEVNKKKDSIQGGIIRIIKDIGDDKYFTLSSLKKAILKKKSSIYNKLGNNREKEECYRKAESIQPSFWERLEAFRPLTKDLTI